MPQIIISAQGYVGRHRNCCGLHNLLRRESSLAGQAVAQPPVVTTGTLPKYHMGAGMGPARVADLSEAPVESRPKPATCRTSTHPPQPHAVGCVENTHKKQNICILHLSAEAPRSPCRCGRRKFSSARSFAVALSSCRRRGTIDRFVSQIHKKPADYVAASAIVVEPILKTYDCP